MSTMRSAGQDIRLSSAQADQGTRGASWPRRQPSLINAPGVNEYRWRVHARAPFNENLAERWCTAGGSPRGWNRRDHPVAGHQYRPGRDGYSGGDGDWDHDPHHLGRLRPSLEEESTFRRTGEIHDRPVCQGRHEPTEPDDIGVPPCGRSGRSCHVLPHDLAFAEDPTLDSNPHQFLIRVVGDPGERRYRTGLSEPDGRVLRLGRHRDHPLGARAVLRGADSGCSRSTLISSSPTRR